MKKLIFAIVVSLFSINGFSQINIGDIFSAGAADAKALAHPYLRPYGEMIGVNLNSGWYTSAKVHKLLGFDITFTGTYTMAPSSAKTYDVNDVNLQSFSLAPNSTSIAPTIAGDMAEAQRPILRGNQDPIGITDFTLPNGSGMDHLISPMVTVGVGLPMGIELKGRFSPELDLGDAGSLSLWGLGVQKDIKDYIPGLKHVPVLNISVLAAYTDFAGSASVDQVGGMISDGEITVDASAFTTRLLVGANLPIVAFYTGIGYGRSSSDFSVLGNYGTDPITSTPMIDPLSLSYTTTGVDFNIGMRLRLGVIGFHADYTVGDYSSITAGLGINFR